MKERKILPFIIKRFLNESLVESASYSQMTSSNQTSEFSDSTISQTTIIKKHTKSFPSAIARDNLPPFPVNEIIYQRVLPVVSAEIKTPKMTTLSDLVLENLN
jgi:hypothetical protein